MLLLITYHWPSTIIKRIKATPKLTGVMSYKSSFIMQVISDLNNMIKDLERGSLSTMKL